MKLTTILLLTFTTLSVAAPAPQLQAPEGLIQRDDLPQVDNHAQKKREPEAEAAPEPICKMVGSVYACW